MNHRGCAGIVVDLDGLLIDSEMWSWQAHNEALSRFDAAPLGLDEVRRLVGLDAEDEWDTLTAMRPQLAARIPYVVAQREAYIGLRDRCLAPLPGVGELLSVVRTLGLRLGLASNSALPSITAALQGLGIRGAFGAVASADEVRRGKPDPAVYLLALERLGLQPSQALAVEDSASGLRAAQAAGLFCVVVPSELTAAQDLSSADLRLSSLREVAAWLARADGTPG